MKKKQVEPGKVLPSEVLENIFTRAAADAARVRLGAAGDNLMNFSNVCKDWRVAARSDFVWDKITPKIWGAEAMGAIVGKKHHTVYKRFSEFKLVHVKLPLPLPFGPRDARNVTALAVSNTHVIIGTCFGSLFSCMLPNLINFQEYNMPIDNTYDQRFNVVGVIHNGQDIFVGGKFGSVLRVRLDSLVVEHAVNTITDCGVMIDFSGTKEHWVGLFAGLDNRAFCVWRVQDNNINLIYKGGNFSDNISYASTERAGTIHGKIRLAENIVVACNPRRIISFDISQPDQIRNDMPIRSIVSTFDVGADTFMVVMSNDTGIIHRVKDFTEVCRFPTYCEPFTGFQNKYFAFLYCPHGGTTTGWDAVTGKRFCEMRRRTEDVKLMIASDRYLVALSTKGSGRIHVWDASKEGIDLGSDDEDEQHM